MAGPLDGACGSSSAVTLSLPASTDYAKLTFNANTTGFPTVVLGNLLGVSANLSFSSLGADQPYYQLALIDGSNSLGQANSSDQILLLQFQQTALSGNTLTLDPNATLFNVYDNTTNTYLQGGQQHTNTLNGWLATYTSLNSESLQELRIGMGMTGSNTGPESMTVNSVDMAVPEPASLALMGVGIAGMGMVRRRRR